MFTMEVERVARRFGRTHPDEADGLVPLLPAAVSAPAVLDLEAERSVVVGSHGVCASGWFVVDAECVAEGAHHSPVHGTRARSGFIFEQPLSL
jgi:hypothetical protein